MAGAVTSGRKNAIVDFPQQQGKNKIQVLFQ